MTHPLDGSPELFVVDVVPAFVEVTTDDAEVIRRLVARTMNNAASLLDTVPLPNERLSTLPLQIGLGDTMLSCRAIIMEVLNRPLQAVALCKIDGLNGRNFFEEETDKTQYYVLIRATARQQVETSDVLRLSDTLPNPDELWEEALTHLTPFA